MPASQDIVRLAVDLGAAADRVPSAARSATSQTVNDIRDTAREMAVSQWGRYGRGMAGSAGQIVARLSGNKTLARGFVMVGGEYPSGPGIGGFMQEVGTSRHPPNPVLTPAAERHADEWQSRLADIAADLLL